MLSYPPSLRFSHPRCPRASTLRGSFVHLHTSSDRQCCLPVNKGGAQLWCLSMQTETECLTHSLVERARWRQREESGPLLKLTAASTWLTRPLTALVVRYAASQSVPVCSQLCNLPSPVSDKSTHQSILPTQFLPNLSVHRIPPIPAVPRGTLRLKGPLNKSGGIAQWLEHSIADREVPGSIPGVPSRNNFFSVLLPRK